MANEDVQKTLAELSRNLQENKARLEEAPAIQTLEWGTGRKSEGEVAEASRLFAEEGGVSCPDDRFRGHKEEILLSWPSLGREKRLRSLLGTAVFSR